MTTPIETAFNQAFQVRWQGTEYGENSIYPMMKLTIKTLKELGVEHLDHLQSHHVLGLQSHLKARKCSASHINKYLSMLSMVLVEALRARPPLTTNTMQIPRVKVPKKMQWWLRPEQYEDASHYAEQDIGDGLTDAFWVFLDIMVHNGLRVREVLALRPDMVDIPNMAVQVPGTKTSAAARTIPIYPKAKQAFLEVSQDDVMAHYTYSMAVTDWEHIKGRMGITHKDATLRALRRTFAAYATTAGMPTATLKDVMGHENITTTERYLNLVGNGRLEESRRYMAGDTESRKYMAGPNLIHSYDGVKVSQNNAAIVNMLEQKGASRESILQLLQEING